MRSPRITRSTISTDQANTDDWPEVDISEWSADNQARFERHKAAILAYLEFSSLKDIKLWFGLSCDQVLNQLNRCLAPDDDGRIKGWRALDHYARVKTYNRTQIELIFTGKAGLSGSFRQFLERCPDIAIKLRDFILKKPHKRDRIAESGTSFQGIQNRFLSLCAEEGRGPDDYPFNVPGKASASVRRFAHAVRGADFAVGAKLISGEVGQSRAAAGTGIASLLVAERPYDTFQLDEHRIDVIGGVRMMTPTGYQLIPISRLILVLLVDVKARCVVGYHVAIRKEASAEEMVLALTQTLGRWKPRQLVVNYLQYIEGAGLPSGVIPELEGACAAELMIDNSMAHWSNAMVTRIRQRTGMAVNWGPIAYWVRRHVVEGIFGILARRGFQRIKSTTGSHPRDVRKDDPAGQAVKLEIEIEELLDLIDVSLANFNARGSKTFGGRSPLSILREFVSMSSFGFLPRKLPELPSHIPDMAVLVVSARIKGSLHGAVARQYVEKFYARYTSPMLAQGALLINKPVRLHINPQDPCTARAFFKDGSELGVRTAMGVWGRKPHTLEMRKEIHVLIRKNALEVLNGEDEISAFNRHLKDKAIKGASGKGRTKISPHATKAAHYARATGSPLDQDFPCAGPSDSLHSRDPSPGKGKSSSTQGATPAPKTLNWPSFLKQPDFRGKAR